VTELTYDNISDRRGETAFDIPLPSRETIGLLLSRMTRIAAPSGNGSRQ
jgi:hypothetical protein